MTLCNNDFVLKTRKLNLIDIFNLKKDLLWGKYYYGLFDNGKLIDCLLYSKLYRNKSLYMIHNTGLRTRDFTNKFISHFARKKVRYFLAEFDEAEQVQDIEFMHSCGFKRYNRNYCFEYGPSTLKVNSSPSVHCRSLEREDIPHLIDIDISSQILEYRDEFYRGKKFFKEEQENIVVFCRAANTKDVIGFAAKRDTVHDSSFDFIFQSKMLHELDKYIQAFAEYYIHFEKISDGFRFVLNENHKEEFEKLEQIHKLTWVNQCLIREGRPRVRDHKLATSLAFKRATAG